MFNVKYDSKSCNYIELLVSSQDLICFINIYINTVDKLSSHTHTYTLVTHVKNCQHVQKSIFLLAKSIRVLNRSFGVFVKVARINLRTILDV